MRKITAEQVLVLQPYLGDHEKVFPAGAFRLMDNAHWLGKYIYPGSHPSRYPHRTRRETEEDPERKSGASQRISGEVFLLLLGFVFLTPTCGSYSFWSHG